MLKRENMEHKNISCVANNNIDLISVQFIKLYVLTVISFQMLGYHRRYTTTDCMKQTLLDRITYRIFHVHVFI